MIFFVIVQDRKGVQNGIPVMMGFPFKTVLPSIQRRGKAKKRAVNQPAKIHFQFFLAMSLLHGVCKIRRPRGPIIKPTIKQDWKISI